jgi:Ni,Fe-hydrogenase III large subunit/NADH:ubiquinone oxidoreductase subunit C
VFLPAAIFKYADQPERCRFALIEVIMSQKYNIRLKNNYAPVDLKSIALLDYIDFCFQVADLLKNEANHCLNYYAVEQNKKLKFFCFIGNDTDHDIYLLSHEQEINSPALKSLTPICNQLHIFEREIHENFGVIFEGHPWLKPIRYPFDRPDLTKVMDNYPFFEIESEELHEVGVGPIHAGVIEPGHFRFICNGEKVLHLEIHLGYQHRGIEKLFLQKSTPLQHCILSESIAGDTAIGHALAHSQLIESLAGTEVSEALQIERCIALELERIAVHIGDTAALCADVAYQIGQAVCEALRTTIINTTQLWCGNRFGKGLIRPGGTYYPLSENVAASMLKTLEESGKRYHEMTETIYSMPSVLSRFDEIGTVSTSQALAIGAVGMAARTCKVPRDIRASHPFQYYNSYPVTPVVLETGDVLARGMLRKLEVSESVKIIQELIGQWQKKDKKINLPHTDYDLIPGRMAVSLVEAWRGEICHSAITDDKGQIIHYKIKDPSMHNWMALALAVRNQEISDFPVCNKSYNLSYCGYDL